MSKVKEMTEADLLDALRAAQVSPDGEGLRTEEVGAILGLIDPKSIRRRIRAAMAAGLLRRGRKLVQRIDGIWTPVTTYLVVDKTK